MKMKPSKKITRPKAGQRAALAGKTGSAPSEPTTTSSFEYSPPAEKQLERMMSAMSDILDLAKNIPNAECFRRHAMRIAEENGTTTLTYRFEWTKPKKNVWVRTAGDKLSKSLRKRDEQNAADEARAKRVASGRLLDSEP